MANLVRKKVSPAQTNSYSVGAVVQIDNKRYRIVVHSQAYVVLIQMDISRYDIATFRTQVFEKCILNGDVQLLSEVSEHGIFSEVMTKAETDEMNRREQAIREMLQKLYPHYEVLQQRRYCAEFEELKLTLGLKKTRVHDMIRSYLQSGLDPYTLRDCRKHSHRKPVKELDIETIKKKREGDLSKEEKETLFFNEVTEKFERSRGKHLSLCSIYDDMVTKYYSHIVSTSEETIVLPTENRPSYDRTRRYVLSHTRLPNIRDGYCSEQDYRNNNRLLVGNAQTGVVGICDVCEIDECSTDMMLVSANDRSQITHRIVMYTLIDVKTTTIIACWPDFQDNSIVGATNCFLTLAEEHNNQTSQYGVAVTDDIYPSRVLPRTLRCDHGAEYMSKEFKRFCQECDIILNPVPPGTGSLKSLVEQSFHQFHTLVMGPASDKGAIIKEQNSSHYHMACANIYEARNICFQFVKWYNQHLRPDDFPLTADQIGNSIPAIPCKLWAYERNNHDVPKSITDANKNNYLWKLMLSNESFKVNRKGIQCHGRYYYCDDEWLNELMAKCGNGRRSITCRYDPRSAAAIYLLNDKDMLIRIPLAVKREEQEVLAKLTWKEANLLYQKKCETNEKYKEDDYSRKLSAKYSINETLESAKRAQGKVKPRKDNMRTVTEKEKNELAHENRIEQKLDFAREKHDGDDKIIVEGTVNEMIEPEKTITITDTDENPFL